MVSIERCEIYITNVCNLNCPNCVTFNNFAFRGHQRWNDYKQIYKTWSQRLHIKTIGILGGEPFVHPDLMPWLENVLELWPNSNIELLSNGTELHRYPEVRSLLEKYKSRLLLTISAHGVKQKQKICNDLMSWLGNNATVTHKPNHSEITTWLNSYQQIKDPLWPECKTPEDFLELPSQIQDECSEIFGLSYNNWINNLYVSEVRNDLGIVVPVSLKNQFWTSAVIYDNTTGNMSLHNSNIKAAYAVCCGRDRELEIMVHHLNRGNLYKCSTVALLPEMLNQFQFDISAEDFELLNKYKHCKVTATDGELENFVLELKKDKPIAQCKFCQSTGDYNSKFEAGTKKIKFYNTVRSSAEEFWSSKPAVGSSNLSGPAIN